MTRVINHVDLTATLGLTECKDGFWLFDRTRGMNLAMRAKTEQSAFVEALTYYQGRLAKVESEHEALSEKVNAFVQQFSEDDDE